MFQFPGFPAYDYFIHRTLYGSSPYGFPHSDICGSKLICSSPQLFAACHVLLRLLMPRHSPCALFRLTLRRYKLHIARSAACGRAYSFRCTSFSTQTVRLRGVRGTGGRGIRSSTRVSGSLNYAGSFRIILLRNCYPFLSSTFASEFPSVALLVFPLFSFQCAAAVTGFPRFGGVEGHKPLVG